MEFSMKWGDYLRVIDLEGNEYPLQATTTNEYELNGNQSISFRILPSKANKLFINDITEMWQVVDHDDITHKIIYLKKQGNGDSLSVEVKGVPLFFDDFDTDRIYEEYNQHMTAMYCFNLIFADSGYNYIINGTFEAIEWEGFGAGDTRLELFKRALNRYKAEFRISGNTIYLENQIGRDTQFMYRYRLNASNIVQENDASAYYTYAKGYGDYGDGEGGEDWKDAKLIREYIHPLSKIPAIGMRHAPPIKNGNITTRATMDEQLKILVDESLKISVTATLHDLRKQNYPLAQPEMGDRVFLIDERIGLNDEVRVVDMRLVRNWRGEVIDLQLTFGTPGLVKRHQSNLQTAISNITQLLEGKVKLPFSVLDNAVAEATKALQAAQTELSFSDNGILSVDKNNPNLVTLLNSAGLGVSRDGGATFENAITGLGVNASVIATGVLNADRVSIFGGNGTEYTFIQGSHIELKGQYRRTWRGRTSTRDIITQLQNGYLSFVNEAEEKKLSFSDFGISTFIDGSGDDRTSGTIEFFSREYGASNGLSLFSSGALGLQGDRVIIDADNSANVESKAAAVYVRPRKDMPGNNAFAFSTVTSSNASETDGYLFYGSDVNGYASGLRFSKSASNPTVYVTDGNGVRGENATLDAGVVRANRFTTRGGSYQAYMNGTGSGTTSGTNYDTTLFSAAIKTTGNDFFIAVSGSGHARVTNHNGYNNGNGITYRPIAAREFITISNPTSMIGTFSLLRYRPAENEATELVKSIELARVANGEYPTFDILGESAVQSDSEENGVDLKKAVGLLIKSNQELSQRVEVLENGTTN